MVRKPQSEKIWVVDTYFVGRHSRILHLPLPPDVIRRHDIKKHDQVKAMLVHGKSQLPDSPRVKLWFVDLFYVRTHSRRLYLPLDPKITDLFGIKKGDSIKVMLVEVFKSPREEDDENL